MSFTNLWQVSQEAKILDEPDLCAKHEERQELSMQYLWHIQRFGAGFDLEFHRRTQAEALVYWHEIQKRAGRQNLGAIS
jgi:hypothetical protein